MNPSRNRHRLLFLLSGIVLLVGGSLLAITTFLPANNNCDPLINTERPVLGSNQYIYICQDQYYMRDGTNSGYDLIDDVDMASFEVLPHLYAKDKDAVYYVAAVGNDLFGGHELREIIGADPQTFKVLDASFSSDAYRVYYVDPRDFELFDLPKESWPAFRDAIEQMNDHPNSLNTLLIH